GHRQVGARLPPPLRVLPGDAALPRLAQPPLVPVHDPAARPGISVEDRAGLFDAALGGKQRAADVALAQVEPDRVAAYDEDAFETVGQPGPPVRNVVETEGVPARLQPPPAHLARLDLPPAAVRPARSEAGVAFERSQA